MDYEINIVFAVLDDMILFEGQKALGEISREKGCIDFNKIHEFAVKYQNIYETADNHYGDVESKFGEDCFDVGFEMDVGKAFINAYGYDALDKATGLVEVINKIEDPMLLGSGFFRNGEVLRTGVIWIL